MINPTSISPRFRGPASAAFCGLVVALAVFNTLRADPFTPLDLRQVQVGGEIGRRMDITIRSNLLVLDAAKDFLAPFQKHDTPESYIGLGKLIDATVRFAANRPDAGLFALKKQLVDSVIAAQEADGYIGIFPPDKRFWTLWDISEMGYLVYGLASDHRYFGKTASLNAARKLADYIIAGWSKEPLRQPGGGNITVYMAVVGLENGMLLLHEQTKDPRYLDFVRDFRQLPQWEGRITLGRHGQIEGHAYAYLCRCIAQLRLDRLSPDPRLLAPTRRITDFMLNQDGEVISGAVGDHECWHNTQDGTINLGETCATAYLIRFWDELLRREGDPFYGDLMERSIYNTLFAAQSPDGRRLRYYTPFEHPRSYWTTDTYCCPCNYRRIVAELPGFVCYRSSDGVAVNLFTPSEITIVLKGGVKVQLTQATTYPASGRVEICVEPLQPVRFPLRIRIPRWCPKAALAINGQALTETTRPGQFQVVDREWRSGDRVLVDFDMPWRLVKGRESQVGRIAVMRGPLVFCLNRERHPELANLDLRSIVIDPTSLEGPIPDDSIRPGGIACRLKAWKPGDWYPHAKPPLTLTLTEFPDPGCAAAYFKVPNPDASELMNDELLR
jgi:DUF1680 family protein